MATIADPAKRPPAGPRPRVEIRPPVVERLVVPLDGSPFAERALPVARWFAGAVGAGLHLVEIVDAPVEGGRAHHAIDLRPGRHAAHRWRLTPGRDPAAAIVVAAGAIPSSLVCLATHGRDRSAAVLGSVAAGVIALSSEPVMLVGPAARPPCAGDAAVVAAVDGHADDARIVAVAAGWAARLGRPLVMMTVAEPVPDSPRDDHPLSRARGPREPERYLAGLASGVAAACGVRTRVVYDPISVHGGLLRAVDRTAALVVLGAHCGGRARRMLLGSHPARVVHDLEVPALVVT
jgi:nucleotide-binding universal stress UspA family protein